jgi:hypothetical protein
MHVGAAVGVGGESVPSVPGREGAGGEELVGQGDGHDPGGRAGEVQHAPGLPGAVSGDLVPVDQSAMYRDRGSWYACAGRTT